MKKDHKVFEPFNHMVHEGTRPAYECGHAGALEEYHRLQDQMWAQRQAREEATRQSGAGFQPQKLDR